MEVVMQSPFVDLKLDKVQNTLWAEWKEETTKMSNEQYKEVFEQIAQLFEQHTPANWLGDIRKFGFFVIPELQEWLATNIMPRFIQAGLKKMAILAPDDFIAQLSVEQSVEEIEKSNQDAPFLVRYFDNEQSANDWLLGKSV